MGRPKLLLRWGETTILTHLIELWTALGAAQIAVVVEARSPIEPHLADVDWIVNTQAELGMFSSVQCAARWAGWRAELTHFVIALGDQPQVGWQTLRRVVEFAAANAGYVCQPSRNGRARHPVVMPGAIFLELAGANESNLKEFLRTREDQRKLLELDDRALDEDIDTPEDYRKAHAFVFGPQG